MMPLFQRRLKRIYPEYCEPAMTRRYLNKTPLSMLLALALLFSGCASVNLESHTAQSANQALEFARQESDPELAQKYLLRAADRFQNQDEHQSARRILQSEQLSSPIEPLEDQALLLSMASAVALDDRKWATELTQNLPPDHFLNYDSNMIRRAASLQERTFALADDSLAAALTLILLASADANLEIQEIHDRIWQNLKETSGEALSSQRDRAIGYDAQGWLELAETLRQPGLNLDEQGRMVRRWQQNWPGHPATATLPAELQLIASLAESRPEQITLAVPLSGPLATAGKAIRDGFLAAYYLDDSVDREKTNIRIVDTSKQDIHEVYEELISGNQDLMVGPLEKEALTTLAGKNTLPVPVLGLNYLPEAQQPPSGLYQFGLAPEDEARQIADRLAAQGISQTLILIPHGEWGDRLEQALLTRMKQRDAVALDIERYFREDNLRAVTADLLGITVSRQRAIDVERTAGIDVEFEPRRRQDADGIIMVAEPTIARQFKPLFAFYFGGDLPVYAPSMVYEGNPDPSRDRDLNGVVFTDIPWVLSKNNGFRKTATNAMPDINGQVGRLFAMGADAWQLSKRLPLLRHVDSASIEGQTGVLTMTTQGSVHREQLWARFTNGTPELLPALAIENQDQQGIAEQDE